MYTLSAQQIDFILNDIRIRGVETEDLQLNLLDHICCIIECELEPDGDFENFYQRTIPKFFRKELKEIEDETVLLLTFKNYYAMKKVMIRTGIFSVIALIAGSLFKIMHWPGAGVLLVLGIASLSLIFLPLMFILKTKDNSSQRDKLILAIGSVIGVLLCWATLFSVMHWPSGNGMLWLSAIAISAFILIPVYFFTGIRNPDTKVNTIVTTVILVGATGLLFTMVNIRPALKQTQIKMHSYIQSDELLKKMQNKSDLNSNALALEINSTCEKMKGLILQAAIGETSIPKNFEEKEIVVEEGNLGPEFFKNRNGIKLFSQLKESVSKYNASPDKTENKIPVDHSILDVENNNIGIYSNFVVLNGLTQIQMYLATRENKITALK